MADGLLFPILEPEESTRRPVKWVEVHRRAPFLRPAQSAPADAGVFGLDLTAGCAHGCPFCHIQASPRYPGEGRVMYDPSVARRLVWSLDALEKPPHLVVLSPTSDPFPPHRGVRAGSAAIIRTLLDRKIDVLLMTRGRIPAKLIPVLAEHADQVRVAVGLTTLKRELSRALEPRCAPPLARVGRIARLIRAGVSVEVRLEPLIPGLTDTAENIKPLFFALASAGAQRVVAHYLFLHTAMVESLRSALRPLNMADVIDEGFTGGPLFAVGTLGTTKHLPLEVRQAGLARLSAWGAEHGLIVETGTAQNPDLPRGRIASGTVFASAPPRAWEVDRLARQSAVSVVPQKP